ncbi:MAG: NDP-sugar synthase [Oscillospiraceae bacterium]|nr:NDP-sugar synthase [Oscillospiraceae bacterium]
MKAIIMAGGKGTRLLPISELEPKPMTRLLGVPLLEHLVKLLRENGFNELRLTLGHKSEIIKDYFGDGERFGVSISYMTEDTPLGTAGSVRACEDFIDGEDFLVISGDAACDFPLRKLFERHVESRSDVTMALYPHPAPLRYGTVVLDSDERIISFIEKPSWSRVVTNLVNTGIYVISPQVMDPVPTDRPFDFARDLFPILEQRGAKLTGLTMEGYWCDIGDSASYRQSCMDALTGKLKADPNPTDYVFVGRGVFRMDNDVIVIAPAVISRDAELGASAVIERSIVHAGSVIGAYSNIRESVIDGGKIGEKALIEGSVVCREAQVAPNAVTQEGDVIARGGAAAPPPEKEPVSENRREKGLCRELSCSGRAELMRAMSGALWEAGADFSDGISLKDGKCRVRIYPLEEEVAISVEATGGSQKDRLAACQKYSNLAESFGGVSKGR